MVGVSHRRIVEQVGGDTIPGEVPVAVIEESLW
jgi:hypothetical protein